jgi:phospholipid/cholesterol/gamma-HCH transport system substrate-binding protein
VEALDRVNRLLSDQNIKSVGLTLSDIQSVTAQLKAHKELVGDTDAAIKSIDQTAQQISQLSESTNKLVNGDGKTAIRNLSDAAEELKGAAHQSRDMLSKLDGPTTDFATNGLPELTNAIGSLQTATDTLNRVLNEAERSPSGLISKPKDKEIEVKP